MRYAAFIATVMMMLAPLQTHASTPSTASAASLYRADSPLAPHVGNLNPVPGLTIKAFLPPISADIDAHGSRLHGVHLYVDGQDVTRTATLSGAGVNYVPQTHLQPGWHDVFLEGADAANHAFSEAWVFRTESPDIALPMSGRSESFGFIPAGGGRFHHFFLFSPFDGFGLVRFCGFSFPLVRVGITPVFFTTVPIGFGPSFFACNPGLFFTPFQPGIGFLNPIFFPIEIAGPSFFQPGHHHGPHPMAAGTTTMPLYGTQMTQPGMPIYRSQTTMPIYRTQTTMPIYRTQTTMPVYRTQPLPAYPIQALPGTGGAVMPSVSIPQPYIPH